MNKIKKLPDEIQLDRLKLRKANVKDAADMFEYTSDEETVRFITIVPHDSIQRSISAINNYFLNPKHGKYVIELVEENKMIGGIDIRRKKESYDIGYILNKKYHNKGYGAEALNGLVNTIFEITSIEEIKLFIDIENTPSNKLAIKCNFLFRGQEKLFNEKFNQERIMNIYVISNIKK